MNKLHIVVKRLKKEDIGESAKENAQVESLAQKLKEPISGEQRHIDEHNQIEISEDVEEVQAAVLEHEEENKSVDLDQDVNDIQENMADAFVPTDIEVENIQNPRKKKSKGKSMVELKSEGVLISSLKFRGRSYAMIGESNWRPKTRPKNNLRLNMKKILNPKLAKDVRIINPPLSKFGHMSKSGVHPVYL